MENKTHFSIPFDKDTTFSHAEDLREILSLHGKMCSLFTQPYIVENPKYAIPKLELEKIERTQTELLPDNRAQLKLNRRGRIPTLSRIGSQREFIDKKLTFKVIEQLLENSFSPQDNGSRPYPSGGALHPIEVVIALHPSKIADGPEPAIYHYLPLSHSLEKIARYSERRSFFDLYQKGLLLGEPHAILIYFMNISRAINKYGLRGYRHGLMEVGSMYQQVSLVASKLKVDGCVWSFYSDHRLNGLCRLRPTRFVPCVLQLIGIGKEESS